MHISPMTTKSPPVKRKRQRTSWNVPASDIARNTFNPIRSIVDGMKLTPNPEKPMIALSIGITKVIELNNYRGKL